MHNFQINLHVSAFHFSLKLYKDDKEFYSYIPRLNKKERFFNVTGVDIERSVCIAYYAIFIYYL